MEVAWIFFFFLLEWNPVWLQWRVIGQFGGRGEQPRRAYKKIIALEKDVDYWKNKYKKAEAEREESSCGES